MKSPLTLAATCVGLLALAGTIVPPAVFMLQSLSAGGPEGAALPLGTVQAIMLASTIAWFVAAPFWMRVE